MTISTVIATYNRAPLLRECLQQLARQPHAEGDEVVVVDNGSTDATPQVLDEAAGWFAVPLRRLRETRPGKSHALAAALAVAGADILAFTDDDVIVAPSWLDAIRRVMADGGVALAGGPVVPRWETAPPRWLRADAHDYGRLAAPLGLLNYGPEPMALGPRTALGANLIVRREVLAEVGGFATHLGKLRGTLLSGEDHELCRRVQAAGFRAVYHPDIRVSHWVPAERMRARYTLSWFFWSGITHATLDAPDGAPPAMPIHLLKRAAGAAVRGSGAAALGRFGRAMDHAVDVAFAAGYFARCSGLTHAADSSAAASAGASS